jgi:osmoprotectant transport system permease protein
MDIFSQAWAYGAANTDKLTDAIARHGVLVAVPLALALVLGLPLGFWSARSPFASTLFINGFNALRVIPSLAILFLAIPYFGLTIQSAAIALTLLAIPPILISTDVAFRTIDSSIREAALGMGMSSRELLQMVELPLAVPIILAGIKTATIEVIASATLAAFIGAGGLGDFIVLGFAQYDPSILLVGAIPVAFMALLAEFSFSVLQGFVQPHT